MVKQNISQFETERDILVGEAVILFHGFGTHNIFEISKKSNGVVNQ